jgi:hypothetical protein
MGVERKKICIRLVRARDFSVLHNDETTLGPTQPPTQWGTWGCFREGKQARA